MLRWTGAGVVGAALVLLVLLAMGSWRWRARTTDLHRRLDEARVVRGSVRPATPDLATVPEPVRRYLEVVLPTGWQSITSASLTQDGSFNMSETGERWRPFSASQRVVTRRPGFVWDGRISVMPGVLAHGVDSYVAGAGALYVAIAGLIPAADVHDSDGAVARGELLRFLAEAPWYPTALVPSEVLAWSPIDDRSALVTLSDGPLVVQMTYTFGADGLVERVHAQARGRTVDGVLVPTPWEGSWSDYEPRDGMLVPTRGEVAWLLPEGPKPYWRGRITSIAYEYGP